MVKNEERTILRFLIEHKEQKFSINQLAKIRAINYKSAYQNIIKLKQRGIIQTEKLGGATLCSFNYQFDHLVFEVESERKKIIRKNKKINSICRELDTIDNPFFMVLLFGSYSKRTQNKHSDIDLLIIVDDKDFKYKIRNKLRILPFDIHDIDLTTTDFLRMVNSKKFTVVEEVKKNNVILVGIDAYYRLIKNVRY